MSHAIYIDDQWFDSPRVDRLVLEVVHRLAELGIKSGELIALQSRSSWCTTLMCYASVRAGIAVCPLDPDMPDKRRNALMVLADTSNLIQFGEDVALHEFSPSSICLTPTQVEESSRKYDAGDLLIATSGSSGEPKGVLLSQTALLASAHAANKRVGFDADSLWLVCLPLFHIGGLSVLVRSQVANASMILHDGFSAERVWEALQRHSVSHVSLVPVMLQRLLDTADGQPPPEHLRVVLVGGAALNKALAQKVYESGWPIWVTYGMSETASQIATRPVQESDFVDTEKGFSIPLLEGAGCLLVDDTGAPTIGTGRIKIKANFLMSGYVNSEGQLARGLDEDGWFVTSDVGQFDGESITVMGRADEVLVIGGKNIHPAEVEELLSPCPGTKNVCVLGVDDPVWGSSLCAVFEGDWVEGKLETWCRENIQGAYRPTTFLKLDQLPRLASGKLDKALIKKWLVDNVA